MWSQRPAHPGGSTLKVTGRSLPVSWSLCYTLVRLTVQPDIGSGTICTLTSSTSMVVSLKLRLWSSACTVVSRGRVSTVCCTTHLPGSLTRTMGWLTSWDDSHRAARQGSPVSRLSIRDVRFTTHARTARLRITTWDWVCLHTGQMILQHGSTARTLRCVSVTW